MNNDEGRVYIGKEAELSVIRAASKMNEDVVAAVEQCLDESERILLHRLRVKARLSCADDLRISERLGNLVITSDRVMFWSLDDMDLSDDLVIDAACIELHALSYDPIVSIYIQIQQIDLEANPLELILVPIVDDDEQETDHDKCQAIFEALSDLINCHPINPNENYEGFEQIEEEDDMIWARGDLRGNTDEGGEVTPEERQAMLDRLDRILVVPPELEQHETQFEDAEEVNGQFDDAEED